MLLFLGGIEGSVMAYVDDGNVVAAIQPGVPYLYSEWSEHVGKVGGWRRTRRFEAVVWQACDFLAEELLVDYPRGSCLRGIAGRLTADLGVFDGTGD